MLPFNTAKVFLSENGGFGDIYWWLGVFANNIKGRPLDGQLVAGANEVRPIPL